MGKLAKIEAIDMSGRVNNPVAHNINSLSFLTVKLYFQKIFNVNANKFDMNELHDWLFNTCNGQLVRKYDQELQSFKGTLYEPNIYFLPTYPYGYDRKKDADFFLRTDCPAWKNRVVTNQKAWNMMHHVSYSLVKFSITSTIHFRIHIYIHIYINIIVHIGIHWPYSDS